jgi:parvulin-like peptidyl-prolyl isomerase
VAIAALALVACGEDQSELVARSDLGAVTRTDLEAYILALPTEKQRPAPEQTLEAWRLGQLEGLLVSDALAAEADGLLDEPEVAALVRRARLNALVEAYNSEYIDPQLDVSDEAVRRYYDEHVNEFGNEEQIRLSHIFRRVDREASPAERDAARAEMEELLVTLRRGANFGDLARERSDSETAHRHGLIGRLDRGALEPELEAIVWDLDEGELSEVVSTPVGFHIFRLDKKIPPTSVSFEEARERLRRRLERQGREQLENEHFERLLAESGAVYRPELVEQRAVVDPETSVFELEDYRIRIADVAAYVRTTGFLELRRLPPEEWLRTGAMGRLFVWKAQQEGLDQRPDVADAVDRAERQAKIEIAAQRHLNRQLDELEAAGELETFYDEHYLRFQTPTFHRMRIITAAFDRFAKPYDAFEMLDGLAQRIRAGSLDMADAARQSSDDLSASDGGDLGWVRLDAFGTWFGPRVQKEVVNLSPGDVSEPLLMEEYDRSQLRYERPGYVLVRIEETRPSRVRTFEEAREEVRDLYVERHRRELDTAMRRQELQSIHAEIVEENL